MITLYHAPGSCSLAVKMALTLAKADFKTKIVNVKEGEHLTEEFKKLNPLSKVPAIQLNGQILTEGAAINQFIAETYPNANLLPQTGTFEKAEALKWLMFVYSNIHPHWQRAFAPGRYGDNEKDVVAKATIHLNNLYDILESQLGQNKYLAGNDITIADLYLVVSTYWQAYLAEPLTDKRPNVQAYMQSLLEHPEIGELLKSELA